MKLLSLYEAAKLTGIPKQTLYVRIQQGRLKVAEITNFPDGVLRELSIEDLREFCESEIQAIQSKIKELENQEAGLCSFLKTTTSKHNTTKSITKS